MQRFLYPPRASLANAKVFTSPFSGGANAKVFISPTIPGVDQNVFISINNIGLRAGDAPEKGL